MPLSSNAVTRRDWWLGVLTIVAALFFHAVFPRYEWREWTVPARTGGGISGSAVTYIRFDRWTGQAALRYYDLTAHGPANPTK
jgi:hypothetical protein